MADDDPMTCRHLFYRLVAEGTVPKTESAYKRTVIRLLSNMRLSGEIPFSWIADSTRWMRKPASFSGLREMLEVTTDTYRRALWLDQPVYVEIWAEKDAIASILYSVTASYNVPLLVSRGFSSLSFLAAQADYLREQDRPCYVYHFGDHDPSGIAITANIEKRLREFAPDVDLHFERAAVTESQIETFNLPTRPTKKSDSRSKGFDGNSVDVDAIPASVLRVLCEDCITRHVDQGVLERTRRIEDAERESILTLIASMTSGGILE